MVNWRQIGQQHFSDYEKYFKVSDPCHVWQRIYNKDKKHADCITLELFHKIVHTDKNSWKKDAVGPGYNFDALATRGWDIIRSKGLKVSRDDIDAYNERHNQVDEEKKERQKPQPKVVAPKPQAPHSNSNSNSGKAEKSDDSDDELAKALSMIDQRDQEEQNQQENDDLERALAQSLADQRRRQPAVPSRVRNGNDDSDDELARALSLIDQQNRDEQNEQDNDDLERALELSRAAEQERQRQVALSRMQNRNNNNNNVPPAPVNPRSNEAEARELALALEIIAQRERDAQRERENRNQEEIPLVRRPRHASPVVPQQPVVIDDEQPAVAPQGQGAVVPQQPIVIDDEQPVVAPQQPVVINNEQPPVAPQPQDVVVPQQPVLNGNNEVPQEQPAVVNNEQPVVGPQDLDRDGTFSRESNDPNRNDPVVEGRDESEGEESSSSTDTSDREWLPSRTRHRVRDGIQTNVRSGKTFQGDVEVNKKYSSESGTESFEYSSGTHYSESSEDGAN